MPYWYEQINIHILYMAPNIKRNKQVRDIWISHGSDYEDCYILGYNAV
jgi:hypothetical protein